MTLSDKSEPDVRLGYDNPQSAGERLSSSRFSPNADTDPNRMIPRTAYRLLAEKEAELRGECERLCAELFVAAEALAQAGDQLDDRWFLEKSERARIAAGGHNHV